MKASPLSQLTWLALWLPLVALGADCGNPPTNADRFVRNHRVHHLNGTPSEIVQDKLNVWQAASGVRCFSLHTEGVNGHQCDVGGEVSPSKQEFRDGPCSLGFKLGPTSVRLTTSAGWQRAGAGGTCVISRCGTLGSIEPGTYRREK